MSFFSHLRTVLDKGTGLAKTAVPVVALFDPSVALMVSVIVTAIMEAEKLFPVGNGSLKNQIATTKTVQEMSAAGVMVSPEAISGLVTRLVEAINSPVSIKPGNISTAGTVVGSLDIK